MTLKGGVLLNDEGVSPVLGAVLILAIGMTVLTTVQVSFMPVWNAQEDLNHLEKMNDDFRELKSSIESGTASGTALSSPLSMGFKYTQKIIGFNPRERAYATFNIQKDVWAEVRYNEVFPDGMDDTTSIKNITSSSITYSLLTPQNLSPFIYEHGLIRRTGSNYTASAQSLVTNGLLYLLGVNATEPESTTSVERRVINIYPTSPAKNSVIGRNVWLTLHTRYVDWWTDPNNPSSIRNLGGTIKKKDSASGTIIAYFDRMEIRMGETQVTTLSKKPPSRLPQYRLAKITPQNVNLPVEGTQSLVVEVQDYYNNPVPNVVVNFSINTTRIPGNAYSTATLLQNSAISGADGRANILLRTSGPGIYYIDAGMSSSNTSFVYPASSQGGFISLAYAGTEPTYTVTATLRNVSGEPWSGQTVSFAAGNGTVTPASATTDANGNASTTLDTSTATGIKITNIQTQGTTNSSANITWDTVNTITVATNRTPGGYIFGTMDVPTRVNTTGCVRYGTSPGNYPYQSSCDTNTASHSITLKNLQPYTVYYFIANSSRTGVNVNSSEYIFVTETGEVETVPPGSITNLMNVTYLPLYINWTWNDPADADFKEVQVYIDGAYKTTVAKGMKYYNASYFRPNSTHTISTHTVDTNGNVNTTWMNHTANTSSAFTYVFGYDLITGTVTSFGNAQNASDSAFSTFAEEMVGGTNKSNRTISPAKTIANGTQWGTYSSGYLDTAGDGFVDITNLTLAFATKHATGDPAMVLGTITGGTTYLNTVSSNGQYLNLRETTAGTMNSQWNSWEAFTNASNSSLVEMNIGIEAYVADGEGVYVKLWNFSSNNWNTSWNQLGTSGLPTSDTNAVYWYNITNATQIQRFVNSTGNFGITLADAKNATGSADGTRDYFYIDEFKVVFKYYSNTLNVSYTFTETNSSGSWQNISIQDSSYGDALANVSIFNATSGLWESILATPFSGGTAPAQHVNAVKGANGNASNYDAGSGQINIMYNWTGSTANNSLGIDLINVTIGYFSGGVYKLNITTNTTEIPIATNQILELRYNVSGDNFTMQLWNGSVWNNRSTLNQTTVAYQNLTLLPEELIPAGSFAGNAASIDKYYALIRYLDLNASGTQGKLYLDYQRVNSS